MDYKVFFTIFITVFLAELGDKTQLSALLFASDKSIGRPTVFIAASLALIVSTAIAVIAGSLISNYINTKYLSVMAGIGFIVIGGYTIYSAINL